jgi:hypothetical protein
MLKEKTPDFRQERVNDPVVAVAATPGPVPSTIGAISARPVITG